MRIHLVIHEFIRSLTHDLHRFSYPYFPPSLSFFLASSILSIFPEALCVPASVGCWGPPNRCKSRLYFQATYCHPRNKVDMQRLGMKSPENERKGKISSGRHSSSSYTSFFFQQILSLSLCLGKLIILLASPPSHPRQDFR